MAGWARARRFRACLIGVAISAAVARAQVPQEVGFDIRVNVEDQRDVHLALTAPNDTTQELQVDGRLSLKIEISALLSWGGRWINVFVMDNGSGTNRELALMDWPIRPEEPAHVQWLAFSLCGDRVIALRDGPPGRCADLPPAVEPDPLYGPCGVAGTNCLGPYEAMPADIASHERIAPLSEPGEPLRITGRVLGQDGSPRPGIIVYAYQTDRNGVYPPVYPPRSSASNYHGRLRGWARSDDRGYYAFDTIRPGDYGGNPEHVHMHVIEPGCAAYIIDDLIFAGDPNLLQLTKEQRESTWPGRGGSGVGTLQRTADGWSVVRDVHLGEKIPGYRSCKGG